MFRDGCDGGQDPEILLFRKVPELRQRIFIGPVAVDAEQNTGGLIPLYARETLGRQAWHAATKGGDGDENQILPPEGAGDGGRVR